MHNHANPNLDLDLPPDSAHPTSTRTTYDAEFLKKQNPFIQSKFDFKFTKGGIFMKSTMVNHLGAFGTHLPLAAYQVKLIVNLGLIRVSLRQGACWGMFHPNSLDAFHMLQTLNRQFVVENELDRQLSIAFHCGAYNQHRPPQAPPLIYGMM